MDTPFSKSPAARKAHSLRVGLFWLITVLAALVVIPRARAAGTVTLMFYDRNGAQLSPTQVRSTSNSGTQGYDNDFLVDPTNLRAIQDGPLSASGQNMTFSVPSVPVALALNWPTEPLGFGLIILDNGGAGFTGPATVNFTYQAARDVKRKLDAALAARRDYVPSAAFTKAYDAAAAQLASVDVYSTEPTKGKAGQLALDSLAVAFDLLLAEHGPVTAAANKATNTPWLGFTIDTTANYKANLDLAASLTRPYGWVRVVFDAGEGPSTYSNLIAYAKSIGLKVLGQPVDSSYDSGYTRAQYRQRFIDFLTAFPNIDAWEVGNEVNGSWLSSTIADKIADAATEVRTRAPGKPTVLTFFWQLNTDSAANSMFTWINAKLTAQTRSLIDVVTVSQYQEQAPMGVFFEQMMRVLRQEFPTQKIAIGELGYWIPGQQYWWAYNKADPNGAARRAVAAQYHPASFDFPGSIGGVFWWNFITEFSNDPALQLTMSKLRDALVAGAPLPSTPTPTASPSPTPTTTPSPSPLPTPTATTTASPTPSASPTGTRSPTPSPSPSPSPAPTAAGVNTRSGVWGIKALIGAKATWSDLYQTVTVSPRTTCEASVWAKGTGAVQLQVSGNSNWTRLLAQVRCDGTKEWTKYTTPPFTTASRTRVWLTFSDIHSNAGGTLFLDDAFPGTPNGTNRVLNADFEGGTASWTRTSNVLRVLKNPDYLGLHPIPHNKHHSHPLSIR